jgi:hypothetical protein
VCACDVVCVCVKKKKKSVRSCVCVRSGPRVARVSVLFIV